MIPKWNKLNVVLFAVNFIMAGPDIPKGKVMDELAQDENYRYILEASEKELRLIVDPEKADREAEESQRRVIEANGGEEKLLKFGVTWMFSPTPLNK